MWYSEYPDCIKPQNILKFNVYTYSFASFAKKKQIKKKFSAFYLYNYYSIRTLGDGGGNN